MNLETASRSFAKPKLEKQNGPERSGMLSAIVHDKQKPRGVDPGVCRFSIRRSDQNR
jgi:hypothetical protein